MKKKIQYISQGETAAEQLLNIEKVLDAGGKWIQLRYKNPSQTKVLKLAIQVKKAIESYGCTFIINDSPAIAKEVDADGVHLGFSDMSISAAKIIVGADKIVGGTANTFDDVLQRYQENCSYVGLGPYAFTTTKKHLSPILSLAGYKNTMNKLRELNIEIPIYAIGGIHLTDIKSILETGIYGIALSGAITRHDNQRELYNQLYQLCNHYK